MHKFDNNWLSLREKIDISSRNQKAIDKMKTDEINVRLMEMDSGNISKMLRIDYNKVDKTAWINGWNKTLTTN